MLPQLRTVFANLMQCRVEQILKFKSPARNALAIIEPNDGEKAPNKMRRVSFAEKNEIK